MDVNQKILKYETFLNDVLKEELKKIHLNQDHVTTEIAEYVQIKQLIDTVKKSNLQDDGLKTQVDIGCSFFIEAKIEDPARIHLNVGCGIWVDLSLEEAVFVINKRIQFLESQLTIYQEQSAATKAHIKMVLLGLAELQKVM
ncbi:Prefoldin subunit [Nesidiocoris tenuis]|uniref:Prefoldin subunit n=1 Tax=Nesidiocoris tenuis TaxID=355587 RepID=A0ABN7B2B7_9HEMI|nr:Prefoldin subunit [Nesidiocoris tenuis]